MVFRLIRNHGADLLAGNNVQDHVLTLTIGNKGGNPFGSRAFGYFQLGVHSTTTFTFTFITFLNVFFNVLIHFNVRDQFGALIIRVAGKKAIDLYGDAVIGVITAVLTFGTIVFSEIIPKSLGTHYAPLIARASAPFILVLVYGLYPVVIALEWISNLLKSGQRRIGTEAQIRSLVTIGRRAGYIESDEGQLIHRAFILNDKTAADVMTPLKDIVGVDAAVTVAQAAQRVLGHVYSRHPVFGKSIHNIKGMVMSRDILEALSEGKELESVSTIVRPALTVPANMRSDELLVLFRDRHIHMAIVQHLGKTVGLVTLEDVLEELVGEIEDEKDAES